ncbi:MAG: aminoglycoside phosphotransferase family protein [Deinococcus sp.]
MTASQVFAPYLSLWNLVPDGTAVVTPSSRLLGVCWQGKAAMLKVALHEEEERGGGLMVWWDGVAAARVYAQRGPGVLLERADDPGRLAVMARNGRDDEASRIICGVAAALHTPRPQPPPASLVPLHRWFAALEPAAARHGGVLHASLAAAEELLAAPQEVGPLHGDLHHGNVLHFGERGWLAIDPKGLLGERGYDFANLFCNPDPATAGAPGRLARQLVVVADAAHLDPARLLRWVLAYSGLSAAWTLEDGGDAGAALTVAGITRGLLSGAG